MPIEGGYILPKSAEVRRNNRGGFNLFLDDEEFPYHIALEPKVELNQPSFIDDDEEKSLCAFGFVRVAIPLTGRYRLTDEPVEEHDGFGVSVVDAD